MLRLKLMNGILLILLIISCLGCPQKYPSNTPYSTRITVDANEPNKVTIDKGYFLRLHKAQTLCESNPDCRNKL